MSSPAAIVSARAASYLTRASQSIYRRLARPEQLPPAGLQWLIWLIMAGRGYGKTWTGAGWLVEKAQTYVAEYAVIAPTFTDVRKICVEGPSGILKHLEEGSYVYNRSTNVITLRNGSKIHMLSADEPDRIRGYNLAAVWCDEVGAWRYENAWYDGIVPALRIGGRPQALITTTPRSTKLMRDLAARDDDTIVHTRGSTWDNAANLSAVALQEMRRWEGTTRGRQELHGELLDDMPGAFWRRTWIDQHRLGVGEFRNAPPMRRIVVAVDPSGSAHDGSDECGIVVAGVDRLGEFWVLDDVSAIASPDQWARLAVDAYDRHAADRIVAEQNFGYAMVEATMRHVRDNLPIQMVNASRGKAVRAEPIAALYEQGRVHHAGSFPELEDQMCTWSPLEKWSPDRMDALVWALTELGQGSGVMTFLSSIASTCTKCQMPSPLAAISCSYCGERFDKATADWHPLSV